MVEGEEIKVLNIYYYLTIIKKTKTKLLFIHVFSLSNTQKNPLHYYHAKNIERMIGSIHRGHFEAILN